MTNRRADNPVLASLCAFVRAGLRPSTPLQKAIAAALLIKLVAIVAMRVILFSGEARIAVSDSVLETRLVGAAMHDRSRP